MRRTDEAFRNEVIRRSNKRIIHRRKVMTKIIAACIPIIICMMVVPTLIFTGKSDSEQASDAINKSSNTDGAINKEYMNSEDIDEVPDTDKIPATNGKPEFGHFLEDEDLTPENEDVSMVPLDYVQVYIEMYADSEQVGEPYITKDSAFFKTLLGLLREAIKTAVQIGDASYVQENFESEAIGANDIQYVIYLTMDNGHVETYVIGNNTVSEVFNMQYDYVVDAEYVEKIVSCIEEHMDR